VWNDSEHCDRGNILIERKLEQCRVNVLSYKVPKLISILVENSSTKQEGNCFFLGCIFMPEFELFNVSVLVKVTWRVSSCVSSGYIALNDTRQTYTYLMLIEEVACLTNNMCDKEPAATLYWLSMPKDEWIGKRNHSHR